MRIFQISEPKDPENDDWSSVDIVKTEDDIRKEYWPYWYRRMCEKFGQKEVDEVYCFEDCLDDWIVGNWAIEIKE